MDKFKKYFACFVCIAILVLTCSLETYAAEPQIAAKAAVLIDASNGEILFAKNENAKLQMASTTKILTTLLTLESGDLDSFFEVDSDAIKVEGSSMGLKQGNLVTKRMLCYGMMLPSGNDAANAAAVSVGGSISGFVEMMNKRVSDMGLENTHFVTPSGLDDFTTEHYSTAYEMALIAREALNNQDFREICKTKSIKLAFGDGKEFWLSNTNRLLKECDGVIGVKTGFTDKAGRCLISACERNGTTLICVTLNDPNDWLDHTNLYDYGFKLVKTVDIGGLRLKLPCVGGSKDYGIAYTNSKKVSVMSENSGDLKSFVLVPRFIYLPTNDDEVIGKVVYKIEDKIIAELDLRFKN